MLDILFRDDALVAIHKPAGLLVHRSMIDRHETRFAVQLLRDQLGQHVFPAHRLDKGTSGVLLFALDKTIAARLGQAFERQQVAKHYLAIVRGHPAASGMIEHALSRRDDPLARAPMQPASPVADAQPASTGYRRLASVELPHAIPPYPTSRYALMALTPHTGRRHQLRRHMKHVAHPIIGDATYGKGAHNRLFASLFGVQRLLLACVRLRLAHPVDGTPLELHAPPSTDFVHVMHQLGWPAALADDVAAWPAAAPGSGTPPSAALPVRIDS